MRVPPDHVEAERAAAVIRQQLGMTDGAIVDLGGVGERLNLFTFAAALGENGPDRGFVEVGEDVGSLGAAVVNGDSPPSRRRMTLAHELGHHICGDAYALEASRDSERIINSFAIHFLAPRAGCAACGIGTLAG